MRRQRLVKNIILQNDEQKSKWIMGSSNVIEMMLGKKLNIILQRDEQGVDHIIRNALGGGGVSDLLRSLGICTVLAL
jgi:hypothetical protein